MTYIYEMASGTEYLGEEFSCPKQTAAMATPASHPARGEYQVELRLALVETQPSRCVPSGFHAGLNLNDLFSTIED
jgi:hypothetical protein